jgi:kanosamine 6-kinase
VWSGDWAPGADSTADVALIGRAVSEIVADRPVGRVGVAAAPSLDRTGEISVWPSRPSWTGMNLVAVLQRITRAEVVVGDDGTLAAVAEAGATGDTDLAFIGLGTGVGGGLVVDGRLLAGSDGGAGELGHVPVRQGGSVPPCRCGRSGCLQAFASGPAVLARAALECGATTAIGPDDFVRAVHDRRGWALRALAPAIAALSEVVVQLAEIARPRTVRLGGGFGVAIPGLARDIADNLVSCRRPGHGMPAVESAQLGPFSSLYGAQLLAIAGDPSSALALALEARSRA